MKLIMERKDIMLKAVIIRRTKVMIKKVEKQRCMVTMKNMGKRKDIRKLMNIIIVIIKENQSMVGVKKLIWKKHLLNSLKL